MYQRHRYIICDVNRKATKVTERALSEVAMAACPSEYTKDSEFCRKGHQMWWPGEDSVRYPKHTSITLLARTTSKRLTLISIFRALIVKGLEDYV